MLRLYSMLLLLFIEYNLLLQLYLIKSRVNIKNIICLFFCTILSNFCLFFVSLPILLSLFGLSLRLLVFCCLYPLVNCNLRVVGLDIFQPMALFMLKYLSVKLLWRRLRRAIFLKSNQFIIHNLFHLYFHVSTNWYLFSIWLFFLQQNQHTPLLFFGIWSFPTPFCKTRDFSHQ